MGRVWKCVVFIAGILVILCIGRRTDASELAVEIVFPNLANILEIGKVELPITSEMEETIVEEPQKTKVVLMEESIQKASCHA